MGYNTVTEEYIAIFAMNYKDKGRLGIRFILLAFFAIKLSVYMPFNLLVLFRVAATYKLYLFFHSQAITFR